MKYSKPTLAGDLFVLVITLLFSTQFGIFIFGIVLGSLLPIHVLNRFGPGWALVIAVMEIVLWAILMRKKT